MDSFNRHLDELEELLEDRNKRKTLLENSGALVLAAYVGCNPIAEALIQKGVGKGYTVGENINS